MRGTKKSWFLCAGRKGRLFSVGIDMGFVFEWAVEIDLVFAYVISVRGMEQDMISV